MINLSKIGMEKGKQYETIISSHDINNVKNAAPIGIICSGSDKVVCRIFKGSKTLDNILKTREFVINITHDPELFLLSSIGNLSDDYFNSDYSIKNVDAYAKCRVISFKSAKKQSDPIRNDGEAVVFKSKIDELTINNEIKAFNRGFGCVLNALDDFKNFNESKHVVLKVGYKEDIEAIKIIEKELINKS